MKINRKNALRLWEIRYGDKEYVDDFHGYMMCKSGYGNPNYYVMINCEKIYCGWNIHHILPKAFGGTNDISNLLCTNIATNAEAADKITFWIDDSLYQVQRYRNGHSIFRLN